MRTIKIPELTLVALIGPTGAGKSTFAAKHFLPTEVISSDYCRGLVSDNENDQTCSKDAFDVVYYIAAKRLAAGKLTVIDATHVRKEDQQKLVNLARQYHVQPSAIVFDLPEKICQERNKQRADRNFGTHVVRGHIAALRRSVRGLGRLGFRHITQLRSEEDVEQSVIERTKLWVDKREERGPFDIIGDVHGCYDELITLLAQLGYEIKGSTREPEVVAPEGRRALFVGDLTDRGPKSPEVLFLVMTMVKNGAALCVAGNHDAKLLRKLNGRNVQLTHGLAETMEQLEPYSEEDIEEIRLFLDGLISHYVLNDGKLVVAHAGLKEELQGRASAVVRSFAMYGETTGETDEYGLPVRSNWALDYRGRAMVVYGHTPTTRLEWVNGTLCIDTGCVFGGELTALRYPEKELVSIPAQQMYYEPVRPLESAAEAARSGIELDIKDVLGKSYIEPRIGNAVTIREGHASAALEVMSRFALDPRWLVYLPPTMSPCATADEGEYLEYPTQAFNYYRNAGVANQLVCEEKHMGSRAIVVLCRNDDVAAERFGIKGHGRGVIYTRTGRSFFNEEASTEKILTRLDQALEKSGLWQKFETDWIVLDLELLPWSAKAKELLIQQYAPTGAAAKAYVDVATQWLQQAVDRGVEVNDWHETISNREQEVADYIDEYRNYCWTVDSVDDLKLAPFQILAYESVAAIDKEHNWQLEQIDLLCAADEAFFKRTERRYVDLNDPESEAAATQWWEELTSTGNGEGMVVKPVQVVVSSEKGLLQPAVKCRGRDYLRIIYGPTYTEEGNLTRLRRRGLKTKRSLALREFSLGYEALHRFVEREPLYRVHECVFGVLALESEPVDPRL